MTIYVDVLLAVNLYINYFLLRGTTVLLRRNIAPKRCLAAAALGSLSSFAVLAPELPFLVTLGIKLVGGALIIFVAFGKSKVADFIIAWLCFLVISFIYAGFMLAVWVFAAPFGMYYRNGIAYFDIPIIAVALLTIAAYGIIRLLHYIADKRNYSIKKAVVTVLVCDQAILLNGLADTGNGLCDPFSGSPVVICNADCIRDIIPENVRLYLSGSTEDIEAIRLVPCNTIGGHALVPIFNADISIDGKPVVASVGVTSQSLGADCIFNPNLISL